jgi:hypothetical protein
MITIPGLVRLVSGTRACGLREKLRRRSARRASSRRLAPAIVALEPRSLLASLTPTIISLTLSNNALTYGQQETMTAVVNTDPPSSTTPTGGTVSFEFGNVTLDTENLTNGTATFTTPVLPAGTDTLSASYSGNSTYAGSETASGAVIYTVLGAGMLDDAAGLAVDSAGNVFVVDSFEGKVYEETRDVSGLSTATVVAGGGFQNSPSFQGSALAALLHNPQGIAVDTQGDLFVADEGDQVVREVTPDGMIKTVAGTGTAGFNGNGIAATAAQLRDPSGVAVDSHGDLFIADTGNNMIREVNLTTNKITLVSGSGTSGFFGDNGSATKAMLNGPQGVSLDSNGDIFISDSLNDRIREVTPGPDGLLSDGIIRTVVGGGSSTSLTEPVAALDVALGGPTSVAFDSSGAMFVAALNNDVVREVTPGLDLLFTDGTVTTVAGTGTKGSEGDNGPATAAQLHNPYGVAVDGKGNLYIAELAYPNGALREVKPIPPATVTVTPAPLTLTADDQSISVGAPLPVFTYTIPADQFVNGDTEASVFSALAVALSTAADSSMAGTYPIQFSSLGTLANMNYALTKPVEGTLTIAAATGSTPTLTTLALSAASITYGDQEVLTATVTTNPPSSTTPAGGMVSFILGSQTIGTAELVTGTATFSTMMLPAGNDAVFASYGGSPTYGPSTSTGPTAPVIHTVAGQGYDNQGDGGDGGPAVNAQLYGPRGLATDSAGDLFIADTYNGEIREVSAATGTITTVASRLVNDMYGLAVDSKGDLFVSFLYDDYIMEVIPGPDGLYSDGTKTNYAGIDGQDGDSGDGGAAASAKLDGPEGLAVDAAGDLFIADSENDEIREVSAVAHTINTVAGTPPASDEEGPPPGGLDEPAGVAVDAAGDLFIANSGDDSVCEVSAAAPGVINTISNSNNAPYDGISAIAVDATGNVFVCSGNARVYEIHAVTHATVVFAGASPGNGTGDPTYTGSPFGVYFLDSEGIAVDRAGDVFIANSGYNMVQEVSAQATTQHVSVAPAQLTVTADDGSMTYGSTTLPDLTYSFSGFVNNETDTVLTGAPQLTTTATSTSPVLDNGTSGYPITIAQGTLNAANYTFTFLPGLLLVTPATLSVSAGPISMVYGDPDPDVSNDYEVDGFVNDDDQSILTGDPFVTTIATSASPVGTYPIAVDVSGVSISNSNYAFDDDNVFDGELTVTPAQLVVTAQNASMLYGSAVPNLNVPSAYKITGFVAGDDASVLSGAPVLSTTASSRSGVLGGPYPIAVDPGTLSADNYTFATANGMLSVKPAPLFVTAQNASMYQGGPVPSLTGPSAFVITGFVNGDPASVVLGAPVLATSPTVTSSSPAGVYTINVTSAGTLAAANYTFPPVNFVSGQLTVNPALVTVERVSIAKTKVKKKSVEVIVVKFSGGLNAADAQNINEYSLVTVPTKKKQKAAPVALTSASYTASALTVTLTTRKALVLNPPIKLTITAASLLDALERPLDGGVNFTTTLK